MKRSSPFLPALVSILFCAAAVGASGADEAAHATPKPLTYDVFETAIEHADLETCPAEFVSADTFCRLTLANEQAHVFVFSHEGDQPMVAVKAYDLGETGFTY